MREPESSLQCALPGAAWRRPHLRGRHPRAQAGAQGRCGCARQRRQRDQGGHSRGGKPLPMVHVVAHCIHPQCCIKLTSKARSQPVFNLPHDCWVAGAGRGRAGEGPGVGVQRAGDSGGGTVLQRGVAHRHQLRAELSHGPPDKHRARHRRAVAVRAPYPCSFQIKS